MNIAGFRIGTKYNQQELEECKEDLEGLKTSANKIIELRARQEIHKKAQEALKVKDNNRKKNKQSIEEHMNETRKLWKEKRILEKERFGPNYTGPR
jgi:hypothetical protein